VKPRQGRGRAGFNEIESGQKVVRASFGEVPNAESSRIARSEQHDLRRGRAKRCRGLLGPGSLHPAVRHGDERRRHRASIVVAFAQQKLPDRRAAAARNARSLAPGPPVCVDFERAAAAAAKQANRPIRAAPALAE